MKDLIDLMKQEQKALMAKAQPYIDQHEAIQRAIDAMGAGEKMTKRKRAVSTKMANNLNIPKGKVSETLRTEIAAFLKSKGGRAKYADILKHLRTIGVAKRGFKCPAAYLRKDEFPRLGYGIWSLAA